MLKQGLQGITLQRYLISLGADFARFIYLRILCLTPSVLQYGTYPV